MIEVYRHLHMHPELLRQEINTPAAIVSYNSCYVY